MTGQGILAAGITIGGFKWTGSFTTIDLIAATTNALNGALLARRPDHYRNFTIVGVLLMALLGGIGGGVTRDVILGLFQFMTSFSLPWYAIAGAEAAEKAGLPVLGVLALAVIGPTAGRWYIDVSSGVPPKQFIRGEWFVTIAALTGLIWVICDAAGFNAWLSAGISFVIGFTVRLLALYLGWEEPLAKEPAGVYQHSDGRPLLGRKIAGKSRRELHDLGLLVETPASGATVGSAGS